MEGEGRGWNVMLGVEYKGAPNIKEPELVLKARRETCSIILIFAHLSDHRRLHFTPKGLSLSTPLIYVRLLPCRTDRANWTPVAQRPDLFHTGPQPVEVYSPGRGPRAPVLNAKKDDSFFSPQLGWAALVLRLAARLRGGRGRGEGEGNAWCL